MNFLQFNSYKTATWLTVAVAFVGFALLIAGAALTGIAYTEVRPNYADENYNRYMGAHLQRTVGPIMLAFGALLLIGGCVFLGFVLYATQQASKPSSKASSRRDVY
ncbi:uncharacterized protein TNCT_441261 [Trichonephila clavata]|uniref:Uncharacterized protein n=3 Tax=Trichonephila TaxID=2585208 RepID=A0A8X6F269_TRICU|nr:uncharacterized protein TNCT_441261 [Trichonephila clavata]GFY47746.1 uncharacterized protein TNIN_470441 [Trichonephila inaurata madagascariensis]